MACRKYTLKNTGTKLALFNYQRCQDAIWQYEVPLNPGQSKNIWLVEETYSTLSKTIQVTDGGVFPAVRPPVVDYGIDLNLSLQIIPGSLYFNYVLSSNLPAPKTLVVEFTSEFETFYGENILITSAVTIYQGSYTGSTLIYYEDEFLGNLTGQQSLNIQGSTYTASTITEDQIILDAVVINEDGVLFLGNDYYLDYVIIAPTPSVTRTVTPTVTPFRPPTPTPTPGLTATPTPTPSVTRTSQPLPTPSVTPTQTQIFVNFFISKWTTYGPDQTVKLPLSPTGNYYCSVDWGDGTKYTLDGYNENLIYHTYSVAGTYTMKINGRFEGFNFSLYGDSSSFNFSEITRWGCLRLGNGGSYFENCSNLILSNVQDVINLSGTTNLSNMFNGCTSLTSISGVSSWNTSGVTNMSAMFANSSFDGNIGTWNVSNVSDMSFMFLGNTNFNRNIGNWNISSVNNFSGFMASNTSFSFDSQNLTNIYNGWLSYGYPQTGLTINFGNSQYTVFGQNSRDILTNVYGWNITDGGITVTSTPTPTPTITMTPSSTPLPFVSTWTTVGGNDIMLPLVSTGTYSFYVDWGDGTSDSITSWNQPEKTHTYPSGGTYTVTITGTIEGFNFSSGFYNPLVKDKITSIIKWGNLKLGNDGGYFYGCTNLTLTSVSDILNLQGTTNLKEIFFGCTSLTTINNINNWNVSNVTDMSSAFFTSTFDDDISNWNVSNVVDMSAMFNATPFNYNINNWVVSACTATTTMFANSMVFNQPLNNWDVSNVVDMSSMFSNTILFDQPLSGWNTSSCTNMSSMFSASVFNQNINNWNVSSVTNMSNMFYGANQFDQPLSNWNVSSVTGMTSMFQQSIFNQNINNWNVSNVTVMDNMFAYSVFDSPLSGWNVSNVTNMDGMFIGNYYFNQNINSWNVSGVTSMFKMFQGVYSFNQPLSGWNVSNVVNMSFMFQGATGFSQDISLWNVSSVTNMSRMFDEANSFNSDISSWNVSGVTNMSQMFYNASTFNQDLSGWCVTNIPSTPTNFATGASAWVLPKPVWGTCPP